MSRYLEVFFRNGWFELSSNIFYTEDTRHYFHVNSLTYPYTVESNELLEGQLTFDEFLDYIFNGDSTKRDLVYQIIGAILSNVPLKNFFIFQGVSNGGKTLLSNAIIRLLDSDDVEFVGSINEINATKSKSYEGRKKLLYIDDAPNDK